MIEKRINLINAKGMPQAGRRRYSAFWGLRD